MQYCTTDELGVPEDGQKRANADAVTLAAGQKLGASEPMHPRVRPGERHDAVTLRRLGRCRAPVSLCTPAFGALAALAT